MFNLSLFLIQDQCKDIIEDINNLETDWRDSNVK